MQNSSQIHSEPLFRMKNSRGIGIRAQNYVVSDPELKIIEIMTRHHEYMRKAAWCIEKNFPGSLF